MENKLIPKVLTNKKSIYFWLLGFFAFLWIILRTGTSPKRMTYPCQKAAYPLAANWIICSIGIVSGHVLLKRIFTISLPVFVIVLTSWLLLSDTSSNEQANVGNYPIWESVNPTSKIFMFDNIPLTSGSLAAGNSSVPDANLSDPAIDTLLKIMENQGLHRHKTISNPDGLIFSNDIVIIKPNFQWRHRLGTNTDRVKGLIWQILNHPEGFNGEILVCDNEQSQTSSAEWLAGFNDYSNNSDDLNQSIVDVVNTFKAKGYPVGFYAWDSLNSSIVTEYNEGDLSDGYIYDASSKTSYPKFLTPKGNYVSLKNGIWNNSTKSYNKTRLSIINFPVLKAHGIVGATIALKNYIGIMNATKFSEWFVGPDENIFHNDYCFSDYALIAREMEICWPKLNIIDATWVAPLNNRIYTQQFVQANTILA